MLVSSVPCIRILKHGCLASFGCCPHTIGNFNIVDGEHQLLVRYLLATVQRWDVYPSKLLQYLSQVLALCAHISLTQSEVAYHKECCLHKVLSSQIVQLA